jgi:hypothetical protein
VRTIHRIPFSGLPHHFLSRTFNYDHISKMRGRSSRSPSQVHLDTPRSKPRIRGPLEDSRTIHRSPSGFLSRLPTFSPLESSTAGTHRRCADDSSELSSRPTSLSLAVNPYTARAYRRRADDSSEPFRISLSAPPHLLATRILNRRDSSTVCGRFIGALLQAHLVFPCGEPLHCKDLSKTCGRFIGALQDPSLGSPTPSRH